MLSDIRIKYNTIENKTEFDSVYSDKYDFTDDTTTSEENNTNYNYIYQFCYKDTSIAYVEKYNFDVDTNNICILKAYYWNGELFLIYKFAYHFSEETDNTKKVEDEELIYIYDGKVIKYLTKKLKLPEDFDFVEERYDEAIHRVSYIENKATPEIEKFLKDYIEIK